MKRKLTDKQQQAKKAAAIGRKRIAIAKEQSTEAKTTIPVAELTNGTTEESTPAVATENTVHRDPHGRPAILIERGHTYAHLIGRRGNDSIGRIKVNLRELENDWRPVMLMGEPYPPARAAKFWLALPLATDEDKGGMSESTRATLGQIVTGESTTEFHSTTPTERITTMSTKKASKKTASKANGSKKDATVKAVDTRKITVLAKENPKRAGSAAAKRFELYKKSKTIAEFLAAGGGKGDIAWDEAHKFIQVGA